MPSGLPDFRNLVLQVYEKLDKKTHEVMKKVSFHKYLDQNKLTNLLNTLETFEQRAEAKRFCQGDYDIVLGMLERRMEQEPSNIRNKMRTTVADIIRNSSTGPDKIHKSLMCLAERGGTYSIVTTNFDLLLEKAAKRLGIDVQKYALGGIPIPRKSDLFSGIFHLHGALDENPKRFSDMVLTDQDFGEFYMRRRIAPDFIYDATRLFSLVLVGYSANDPPMKYLLNAVAGDEMRFEDHKERFAFVPIDINDHVALRDWKSRGITPIPYTVAGNSHIELYRTLDKWALLFCNGIMPSHIDREVKRIVKKNRASATEADRNLFDHIVRRASAPESVRISGLCSTAKADVSWLDAINAVLSE